MFENKIKLGNSGFWIKFENGYSVSVQFGPGNYCSNHNIDRLITEIRNPDLTPIMGGDDAECAILKPDGDLLELRSDRLCELDIEGTITRGTKPDGILALMNYAASL